MKNYYFVASLLPDLEIGHVPALHGVELKALLHSVLDHADLKKIEHMLREVDVKNFRAIWVDEPIDKKGNYNREELEEALKEEKWPNGEEFHHYLKDYLERYPNNEQRVHHFSYLMKRFYEVEQEIESDSFLKGYFEFQRQWRLIIMGFRAKEIGKDISEELQYEQSEDPLVAQLLAQKDSKTFEPPFEYSELKPLFEAYRTFPLELHRALSEYRLQKIEQLYEGDQFSIDRILGYLAQLLIIEEWLELNSERGLKMIDNIVKDIQ